MIWIVGEYAERIDNADELLESFLDTYRDEVVQVEAHPHVSCSLTANGESNRCNSLF